MLCGCLTYLVRDSRKALLMWTLTRLTVSEMAAVLVACAWRGRNKQRGVRHHSFEMPSASISLFLSHYPPSTAKSEQAKDQD